jgi:hypothetical protein
MNKKPVQEISIPAVLIEPDENCYFYQEEQEEGFTSSAKRLKQCSSSFHHSLRPPYVVVYGLLSLKKSPVNDFQPLYHPHYSPGLPSDSTLAGTEWKAGTVSPTALSPTLPLRLPSLTENEETASRSPPSSLARKRTLRRVISSSLPKGRPICPPPFLPRLATGTRLARGAPAPLSRR